MNAERLTDRQIKESPEQQLKNFKKTGEFLVAIDTDGCVTDNMNGKQMLIFHPLFMEFYGLWKIESYFREVAEYYNLFSVDRGCNRFIAIQLTMKALSQRKDMAKCLADKRLKLPDMSFIDRYIEWAGKNKTGLGNPSLEKFIAENPGDYSLCRLLGWSEAVNRSFPGISAKIPPFENVMNSLELIEKKADIIVVSKTPYNDLADYWKSHGIDRYIRLIAGQEMGSKEHHIALAKSAGKYPDKNVLMLGDGAGDLKAVRANKGVFYPVPPGKEQEAWNNFPEFFRLFVSGSHASREAELTEKFNKVLLDSPPWLGAGYNHVSAYREKQSIRQELYKKLLPKGRLLVL